MRNSLQTRPQNVFAVSPILNLPLNYVLHRITMPAIIAYQQCDMGKSAECYRFSATIHSIQINVDVFPRYRGQCRSLERTPTQSRNATDSATFSVPLKSKGYRPQIWKSNILKLLDHPAVNTPYMYAKHKEDPQIHACRYTHTAKEPEATVEISIIYVYLVCIHIAANDAHYSSPEGFAGWLI